MRLGPGVGSLRISTITVMRVRTHDVFYDCGPTFVCTRLEKRLVLAALIPIEIPTSTCLRLSCSVRFQDFEANLGIIRAAKCEEPHLQLECALVCRFGAEQVAATFLGSCQRFCGELCPRLGTVNYAICTESNLVSLSE